MKTIMIKTVNNFELVKVATNNHNSYQIYEQGSDFPVVAFKTLQVALKTLDTMLKSKEYNLNKVVDLYDSVDTRTKNILNRYNINTLNECLELSANKILSFKHATIRVVRNIALAVKKYFNDSKLLEELKVIEFNKQLEQALELIKEKNKSIDNRKVALLINLASNSAATFGEKRNSILLASKILNIKVITC